MKIQKSMLLIVVVAATLYLPHTQAGPLSYSVAYVYGAYTGSFTAPTISQTPPTMHVGPCPCQYGGFCYQPLADSGYLFSLSSQMELPEVGLWVEDPDGTPGLFDQTFQNTTKTHEEWHFEYAWALARATFGRLESWSSSYVGGCFHTAAEATAAFNNDMANALATAEAVWNAEWPTDVAFERAAGSYCHIVNIGGVNTWRSVNENWGQAAVAYANSITVSFSKTLGDCVCPDSGVGVVGLLITVSCLVLVHHGSTRRSRKREHPLGAELL